jgi:hypothetical protein
MPGIVEGHAPFDGEFHQLHCRFLLRRHLHRVPLQGGGPFSLQRLVGVHTAGDHLILQDFGQLREVLLLKERLTRCRHAFEQRCSVERWPREPAGLRLKGLRDS